MLETIRKRDGRLVPYDRSKIATAIFKAAQSVGGCDRERAENLAMEVENLLVATLSMNPVPTVEEIQDLVEKVLIENGHARTAKAYILYREQHAQLRSFERILLDVDKTVCRYLEGGSWRINENSNMDYSLQGLNNHIIGAVSSRYWLEKVYPPEIREAHIEGYLHIHDLGLLAPYCCGWDLADILEQGFRGASQKVESAPAKHFRTALGQIANFFYTLQGEAAGAQALASFDTYLAPFIRKDALSYAEVKQALQEFIFNLNVPTRVGFQTPFVNLTFDVNPPVTMKGEPVIVGGKRQDTVYGDYQEEMDLLNMAFCEVMTEGDAKGRIFTFPIPTYNITPDFPWGTPVADRIMAMTAKYGIPYFANFLNSDLKPEDVRSMCCRLRLDVRELKRRGGGLFGANPLTGSIGVVTINLPRLGYLAKDEGEFLTLLGEKMDLAKESLVLKRKVLEQFTEQGLYPYSRFYLRHVKEGFGGYWENHFNTIGIVGMHEAALNLLGEGIETDTGHSFAVRVLDYMRARMQDYQEELGRLFNLEATPAEGTSYRLARLDKEAYPDIITAGDREPYYTNSTQLPVNHGLDLFTALENQNDLQQKYTGGTVFHAFLGERITDVRTAAEVVKTVFSNFRLPYFSLTPTFSVCPEHGYLTGEQPLCPQCGRETEIWSRVVGYYRPVKNWNKGKKEEFRERCTFQVEVDRVAQTQVAAGSE
ncbi:MAG: ribonucleoside triphosphate reductase [bacterium]|jgi:anaerobic ribonucleoside-triphosphate reductase